MGRTRLGHTYIWLSRGSGGSSPDPPQVEHTPACCHIHTYMWLSRRHMVVAGRDQRSAWVFGAAHTAAAAMPAQPAGRTVPRKRSRPLGGLQRRGKVVRRIHGRGSRPRRCPEARRSKGRGPGTGAPSARARGAAVADGRMREGCGCLLDWKECPPVLVSRHLPSTKHRDLQGVPASYERPPLSRLSARRHHYCAIAIKCRKPRRKSNWFASSRTGSVLAVSMLF